MNTKLLIDGIVRQTTLLIAQLSTSAGLRAPLAHIADQVFFELSREIEAQGVSRKVAADMFGLALRSYQKKVHRLAESVTERNTSLWEAVLGHLRENGSASRGTLLAHFDKDEPSSVLAILNDLVTSGVVFRTGSGNGTFYGVTPELDYRKVLEKSDADGVSALLWQTIYRYPGSTEAELLERLATKQEALAVALKELVSSGRVTANRTDDGAERYSAERLVLPVGSEFGWEAAVFDHYQAVVTAIIAKLRTDTPRSEGHDVIGGATLSFDIDAEHPRRAEVLSLLRRVREQVNALWDEVEACNRARPVDDAHAQKVWFYFGQYAPPSGQDEP